MTRLKRINHRTGSIKPGTFWPELPHSRTGRYIVYIPEYCARRRDEIIAQLEEQRESEPGSQGGTKQIDAGARSAAILELRNLRAKVENHRELRDEVCATSLILVQCDILEQPTALVSRCVGVLKQAV